MFSTGGRRFPTALNTNQKARIRRVAPPPGFLCQHLRSKSPFQLAYFLLGLPPAGVLITCRCLFVLVQPDTWRRARARMLPRSLTALPGKGLRVTEVASEAPLRRFPMTWRTNQGARMRRVAPTHKKIPKRDSGCDSLKRESRAVTLLCVPYSNGRDEQLLHRNVQRFRGGLVFKANRFCVSLNSRLQSLVGRQALGV